LGSQLLMNYQEYHKLQTTNKKGIST
jgi:hypothetical protein